MRAQAVPAPVRRLAGPAFGLAVLSFAVAWVAYKAFSAGFASSGNAPTFVIVGLNGLSLAGLYFITATGFTLIFGLMRVVNMAHGSLYLLGGYIAWSLTAHHGFAYWPALVVAVLIGGAVGLGMRQLFLPWTLAEAL